MSSSDQGLVARLLSGPITGRLLALAAPNLVNVVGLLAFITLDGIFVGRLGAEALAGLSLVFPFVMLMQSMAAGGMGAAMAGAIARALGAEAPARARALAHHAVGIAVAMAALFSAVFLLAGPALYAAMGGRGTVLETAIAYSGVIFGGALAPWLLHTLGSIARGAGSMRLPAVVVVVSTVLYAILAPLLIGGGLGLRPRGVSGAGLALVAAYGVGVLTLGAYLLSPWTPLPMRGAVARFEWALAWGILRVGIPGALNGVLSQLTAAAATAVAGQLGHTALAAYGMGARLEYVVVSMSFAMGTALVTMVGANVGAGQLARAQRVAWHGGAVACGAGLAVGTLAALGGDAWMALFTHDPAVVAAGRAYLVAAAPGYAFFGLGLALYFACLGAGHLLWPLAASAARLGVVALGGWAVGSQLISLGAVVAVAFVVYALMIGLAIVLGALGRRPAARMYSAG